MDEDDDVTGVVPRPGGEVAFELLVMPRHMPTWLWSGSESSFFATVSILLLGLLMGDRRGSKVALLRGSTAWWQSVGHLRATVLLEVWPDEGAARGRAVEVRAAVERGEHDGAVGLSRAERRRILAEAPRGRRTP